MRRGEAEGWGDAGGRSMWAVVVRPEEEEQTGASSSVSRRPASRRSGDGRERGREKRERADGGSREGGQGRGRCPRCARRRRAECLAGRRGLPGAASSNRCGGRAGEQVARPPKLVGSH